MQHKCEGYTRSISRAEAIAECDREIAAARAEILAGNEDMCGTILWHSDWAYERELIAKQEPA